MAKANIQTVTVEEVVTVEEETIILELSRDEARFIVDVLRRIAGHPELTRRKHAEEIMDALIGRGVSYTRTYDSEAGCLPCDLHGRLTALPDPKIETY